MPRLVRTLRRWGAPIAAIGLLAIACSDNPTAPEVVGRVTVAPSTLTLASGASATLTATVEDDRGRPIDGRPVAWISSNAAVATVASTGQVTAMANLTAGPLSTTILAVAGGQVGSVAITVSPAVAAELRFDADTTTLGVGAIVQLTATLRDAAGVALPGRSVLYRALDTAVVSVSGQGLVVARDYTGPATRSARIEATAEGRADTAVVLVTALPLASIEFAEDSLTLVQGNAVALALRLRAADGRELSGRAVNWASSDSARLAVGAGIATAAPSFLAAPQGVTVTASSEGRVAVASLTIISGFELAENGITVRCPLAAVGDSGVVEGITYTKRSREDLDILVDARQHALLEASCTSGVTDMHALLADTDFNGRIEHWDVSAVTRMDSLFFGALSFNKPLAAWDVRNVTRMDDMFRLASRFNQPLATWDTRNVTDMTRMFSAAQAFNQPIGGWNVGKVTSMRAMFQSAPAFNQPLDAWNVANVTTMQSMFALARAFNQPLNGWDVSAVTTMAGMFEGAEAFNQRLDAWDVAAVTDMSRMFTGASAFNGQVETWDVSQVTSMRLMFGFAPAFSRPLGGWDVSAVTDFVSMFEAATAFNQDLSVWCVSGVVAAPLNFATGTTAWSRPRPVWGTCSPISTERSTVTLSPTFVEADGVSTIEVTIRVRNHLGLPVAAPSPVLLLNSETYGSVGPLTQLAPDWFVATFTASNTSGLAQLNVELDGSAKTISAVILVTP